MVNKHLTKRGVDKTPQPWYNKYRKKRKGNTTMENKWTLIDSQQVGCIWYDDYTNEDGTLCKRVWMDGEEEIWKIG